MKRIIALMFIVALAFTMISCAGGQLTPEGKFILSSAAQKVGYIAYRVVPEARTPLVTVCAIASAPVITEVEVEKLRVALQEVWDDASKINSTDAQMAVLLLNDIVGYIGLDSGNSTANIAAVKEAVENICKGVNLAAPK